MSTEETAMWRVVIVRKKSIVNPKYNYWDANKTGEPRFIILDETYEETSKPFKTLGAAKGYRTRSSHYSPETVVSVTIQKAELVWQTLAEDEL